MSRALWQGRVWTTAAALALGLAAGTWIVMDDRLTWRVFDDVVLADMLLERIAAIDYADAPIDVTGWTTLHYAEAPTHDTWGGYEWVQVSHVPDAAGAVFNRTYYFARRERVARQQYLPVLQLIPDRAFCDIYTNSIYLLTDLGPSGGSASGSLFGRSGTVPVGGWVLHGGYLLAPLFLAPHAHVSSGHFLAPAAAMHAGGRYLFTSVNLVSGAVNYDPNAITVVPGPVDPARASQWRQRHVFFTTNEIMHLPASHDEWIGPGFAAGYGPLDGSDPRVILAPQPAIVRLADQFLEHLAPGNPRTWCDAELATTGFSDFHGWTNTAPPLLGASTGHLARVAEWTDWRNSNRTVRALGPYRALGRAAIDCRTLLVESCFTNVVQRLYISRSAAGPGATFAELLAELAADPGWQLYAETNRPSASHVGMSWGVDGTYLMAGTNYLRLAYETISGTPAARLGASHGPDGWSEATAHLSLAWHDSSAFAVPAGSSLVEQPRTLQRIERAIEPDWRPVHEFASTVPAAPPSPYDLSRIPDDAAWSLDYRMGNVASLVVAACPIFITPLED